VSNRDRFVLQFRPKFYVLFTPARLSPNTKVWAFLRFTPRPSNPASLQLKLPRGRNIRSQILRGKLILKGATASFRNCGRIIWTKYQSSVVFRK